MEVQSAKELYLDNSMIEGGVEGISVEESFILSEI